MLLIERYIFRQLLGPTLWAVVALAALGLLSQSFARLDIIVDQGQGALAFLKIILLAMPQVISVLMPIAIFTAALITFNRLHSEQEIVVCFAGGLSRWRIIAPAMRLAVMAALVSLFINLWVQPWASRTLRDELFAIRADLAATFVREGEFTHPGPGVTVYAEEVGRGGLIQNMFIHQELEDGKALTYTAREAAIVRRDDAPYLVMFDASTQQFSEDGVLHYFAYQEYPFSLADFVTRSDTRRYKAKERYFRELIYPDLSQEWERENRAELLAEAHYRLSDPLYNLAVMSLAVLAVIGGAFSRMGYGRRIAIASAAAAGVRIAGFGVQAACADMPSLNVLQYLVPLATVGYALFALLPRRLPRIRPRARKAAAA